MVLWTLEEADRKLRRSFSVSSPAVTPTLSVRLIRRFGPGRVDRTKNQTIRSEEDLDGPAGGRCCVFSIMCLMMVSRSMGDQLKARIRSRRWQTDSTL